MVEVAAQEFIQRFATDDVRSTVHWLVTNGYELTQAEVGASDWFASFVFKDGDTEVYVQVERSQWFLQIRLEPARPPIDYDLLAVAQRGQTYWETFPTNPPVALRQLPPGLSWRQTLPDVLAWIATGHDVTRAVARVQDQRYVVMWPTSNKAKRLLRTWRAQGLPTPGQA
jgi:hypothetical protein